jgi:aspartate carbamoyltransferase catalytic subunit
LKPLAHNWLPTVKAVFKMHILSSEQFTPGEMDRIFLQADEFRSQLADQASRTELATLHVGRKLCNLFYEPSTRTRLSFGFAADNLGVRVQGTENAREFSSASKGETLEDTIRVINEYGVDIIVLRHHETGAAAQAAVVSRAAIINAGDGQGEHPTQAILDIYTIKRNHGRLDNLRTVMGGDLKHGRTARSLAKMISKYPGNHIEFVSVPELQMADDIKTRLDESGTTYHETTDMLEAFHDADVVYWTRLQKERLANPEAVPADGFVIDATALEVLPSSAIIMHPLPRVGEIDPSIDNDPRAQYFSQAGNGLYTRMALIDRILDGSQYK